MTDRFDRHAGLVSAMAEAQGVDLDEAQLRGALDADDLHDAVLRCTGCTHPEDCAQWLASPQDRNGARPGYCRNGEVFDALGPEART